jgi:hypothetical protein
LYRYVMYKLINHLVRLTVVEIRACRGLVHTVSAFCIDKNNPKPSLITFTLVAYSEF